LTIRSVDIPELDTAAVTAAYEQRVRGACPEHLALALRLLDRLPPARWTLEWYLPWWLGDALGLDSATAREIVLSNLLGLGSVRLQDDLADGDVALEDLGPAAVLSAALYEAALGPYKARFEADSPFWGYLESCMTAWRESTDDNVESRLAARAAPLKISAFAVCLLTDRRDAFPALERCLDLVLEALVLHDHIADWGADLDAGRWNAFVAAVSGGPQLPEWRERHRTAVLVAMMTTDVVAVQFAKLEDRSLRAAVIADTLGDELAVPALGAHLRAFAASAREQGASFQEHYRELGDRAAKLLLQTPLNGRSLGARQGRSP
jgi:hypothetical protein